MDEHEPFQWLTDEDRNRMINEIIEKNARKERIRKTQRDEEEFLKGFGVKEGRKKI